MWIALRNAHSPRFFKRTSGETSAERCSPESRSARLTWSFVKYTSNLNFSQSPWLTLLCRLKQIAIRLQSRMLMLTHLTGHHRKIAIKMLLHLDRDVEVVARSNVEHSHCWVIIPLSNDYTIILIDRYIYIYITMPLFPSKSYNIPIS